jgi:multidrug transporter EmrE-like cation transporter
MMQGKTMLLILASVACSVTGQILLKSGAQRLAALQPSGFLVAAATEVRILAGLAAWGASAMFWLLVLRVAPLSRAYVLTSLSYVIVPLAGVILFGEQLRRLHGLGTALIIVGVACLLLGD